MSEACSADQLNVLLNFLHDNKELARGMLRTSDGRARAKRLWKEISQLLNSLGGSIKTVQQWQKVWTDRKYLEKKNAAAVRRDHTGTRRGPSSASLAQWEIRVLEIIGEGFGGPQTTGRVPAFPIIVSIFIIMLSYRSRLNVYKNNIRMYLVGR
ncbi:hypothetical protein O3G_MSEX002516 [Manduca sexta]|uniref:Regulatory protein zeste n=1 Tax=Manduca sexta TaxID=7130 RepID=A0A922CED1_MANSE|nr:hypothetical protein O3G_MSEX002516 [Manduca sexta]KAG6442833.1 hypothetical protein O3G_MSEX002516 [Manduca sexta]KAG6442834.1 hypothetical protein O3G_MSEX002516 [Manduca sexta]